jgi:hypothetical protein
MLMADDTAARNVRIWIANATRPPSADGVQIGGSVRVLPDLTYHSA